MLSSRLLPACLAALAAASAGAAEPAGASLGDGRYVIEKITFFPSTVVEPAAPGRPGRGGVPAAAEPVHHIYDVQSRGDAYAIVEVVRSGDGFAPKGTFAAGVGPGGSWVFERETHDAFNSRVTLLPRAVSPEELPRAGGPVGGILRTGFVAVRELESLGRTLLDWTEKSDGSIAGRTPWDEPFTGRLTRLADGRLSRVRCVVTNEREKGTYDLEFQLEYGDGDRGSRPTRGVLRSTFAGTTRTLFEYSVLSAAVLPASADLARHWEQLANPVTGRLRFDPATGETISELPGGGTQLVARRSSGLEIDPPVVRFGTKVLLFIVSGLFAALIANNKTRREEK